MKNQFYIILIFTVYTVSSCCGCYSKDDTENEIQHHEMHIELDTVETNHVVLDTGGYVNDSLSNVSEIEMKYGVQWDFCDCIVKNDSIEKALAAATDDAQVDLIFDRMEEVDRRCKTLLTQPNTTPEQRDKHNRKVRKCLKEAGIK